MSAPSPPHVLDEVLKGGNHRVGRWKGRAGGGLQVLAHQVERQQGAAGEIRGGAAPGVSHQVEAGFHLVQQGRGVGKAQHAQRALEVVGIAEDELDQGCVVLAPAEAGFIGNEV
jgi:hypothetical protein